MKKHLLKLILIFFISGFCHAGEVDSFAGEEFKVILNQGSGSEIQATEWIPSDEPTDRWTTLIASRFVPKKSIDEVVQMWRTHTENMARQGIVMTLRQEENSEDNDRRFTLTIFNAGEIAMEKSLMRFVTHPDGIGTVFMQSSVRCYNPDEAGSLIVAAMKYDAVIRESIILPKGANK